MILSNVNIGTGPSTGDGDPLRTAFNVINQNFALISANANVLTQGIGVRSVAGRQGNVLITVNDVIGISSYPNASTVSSWITSNVAALIDSAPDALNTLNEIAAALNDDANVYTTLVTSITTANTAMKGYVDGAVLTLTSNAAVQAGELATLTANAGVQAGTITTLQSNVSTLTANAAVQAGLIANNTSAITTANLAMKGYVDNSVTTANLAMKGYVDSVANLTYYGNANVASYLPTYSGNIKVGTLTFEDLSQQSTAYTGQQFRTNISGNGLTTIPSFLAYHPSLGDKPTLDTNFGFDSGGMWFSGNANDQRAFPIRTNFYLLETDVVEITSTINFATASDDHGIAIFPAGTNPYWKFSTFAGRIQFNYSVGIPQLWGTANSSVAGSSVLSAGNYYTFKFTYDPTESTVTVQTFSGNTAVGSPLDTRSITENLNATEFVVGFDADQDNLANKSYFTGLNIKTLTNGVYNDLEVTNDLTIGGVIIGNLIPQSNVTQSLGNVTHQWKDLYVSSNTIYIGNQALTISSGNLTINGNTIPTSEYVDDAVSAVTFDQDLNTTDNVNFANIGTSTGQISVPTDTDFALRLNHSTFGEANVIVNSQGYMSITGGYTGRSFEQVYPGEGAIGYFGFSGNVTAITGINGLTLDTGVEGSGGTWTFDTNGDLGFPGSEGTNYVIGESEGGLYISSSHNLVLVTDEGTTDQQFVFNTGGTFQVGATEITDGYVSTTPGNSLFIVSGAGLEISANAGAVSCTLDSDGVFTTPSDIDIGGRLTSTTGQLDLEAANNPNSYIQLNNTGDSLFGANANVSILSNGDSYEWIFDNTGNLTLPGNLITSDTVSATNGLKADSLSITNNRIDAITQFAIATSNTASGAGTSILMDRNGAGFAVTLTTIDDTYNWGLYSDNILFPDSSRQYTAAINYTAGNGIAIADGEISVDNTIATYTQLTTANTALKGYTDNKFGTFTLNSGTNTISTSSGAGNVKIVISGADSGDPPAFIQKQWSFNTDGTITFNDEFLGTPLANGVVSTTKIGQWDLAYGWGDHSTEGYTTYSNSNLAAYTGNISAQVNGYDIGYRNIPQVSAGNVTLALADSGKHYYATSAAPLTLTVPSNANVAFPIGTAISIVNKGTANLTVALEAEASMYLAGNATSASRTITSYGMATLMKTATDEWFINGTGVS